MFGPSDQFPLRGKGGAEGGDGPMDLSTVSLNLIALLWKGQTSVARQGWPARLLEAPPLSLLASASRILRRGAARISFYSSRVPSHQSLVTSP